MTQNGTKPLEVRIERPFNRTREKTTKIVALGGRKRFNLDLDLG